MVWRRLYIFALTAECPTPSFNIVAGAQLVPPRRIQPNINSRVEKAILHGMQLKAKDRPRSVQVWLDELIPPPPKPLVGMSVGLVVKVLFGL